MNTNKTRENKSPGRVWSFEVTPDPIPDNSIKEKITTDIVVAGAGVSGLPAALSAAETGAKVVLLEKFSRTAAPGFHICVIDSKLQKKAGIKLDKEDIIKKFIAASEGRANPLLIRKWADRCGEVMDWLINMADATGTPYQLAENGYDHSFGKDLRVDEQIMLQMLTREALRRGIEIRYSTPAIRLIRPGNKGKVTGVIAQDSGGNYIQFNTNKAVVLSTGDYGNDPEMIEKYCSYAADVQQKVVWQHNTGDGHKMALWIGAAIEEPPHCTMIHFGLTFLPVPTPLASFLCVNKFGERFQDEALSMEYIARNVIRQPGRSLWEIFDDKFVEDKHRKSLQDGLKSGRISSSNTIEELASKFGASGSTLKATVDRYNEMVRKGRDLDYCKSPEYLKNTIDKPPFYSCNIGPGFVATLGGLRISIEGQVLDKDWNIIPGLYAAGNTAGGLWGDTYPIHILSGIARSTAITFGRLTGIAAAKS